MATTRTTRKKGLVARVKKVTAVPSRGIKRDTQKIARAVTNLAEGKIGSPIRKVRKRGKGGRSETTIITWRQRPGTRRRRARTRTVGLRV